MPIQPLKVLKRLSVAFMGLFCVCSLLGGCDQDTELPTSSPADQGASALFEGDSAPLMEVPGDPRLKVGKELLMAGRLDEALIIFQTVLEARPDLARALFLNGLALHAKKSHALALDQYLQAESLNQAFAEHELLDYYIAWSAFYAGDATLAQARVERCLKVNPERADPNFLAGILAFNEDRLEDAEQCLERALRFAQLEPEPLRSRELRRAWVRLSDVLARSERREEALQAIENALEIQPDFAESWFRKASILSRLGREAEAEDALARWRLLGGGNGS